MNEEIENEINLKEMTEVSIKAMLYDQIVILERTQNNIKILQTELNSRVTGEK